MLWRECTHHFDRDIVLLSIQLKMPQIIPPTELFMFLQSHPLYAKYMQEAGEGSHHIVYDSPRAEMMGEITLELIHET